MTVSIPICGGCACGAIRYECSALPLFVFQCHCRDCQRATGGPYAVNVWFKTREISFNTEPKNYSVAANNDKDVNHYFCEDCGSPMGMQRVGAKVRGIRAASLDNPGWLVPMANVWTCKAYPWEEPNPRLKSYETQPLEDEWHAVFAEQAQLFKSRGITAD